MGLVVGQICRVMKNEGGYREPYLKRGALVVVVALGSCNIRVFDMSSEKNDDGVWWTRRNNLRPIDTANLLEEIRSSVE